MSDVHFIPLAASMRYAVLLDDGKCVQNSEVVGRLPTKKFYRKIYVTQK